MGRWIEGHADHGEGRRILAELQRLAQGEGYLWAPSDGVLARMAFPRVQTFGSSRAPQRDESAAAPRMLAAVDLSAIAAALAEMEGFASGMDACPAPGRHGEAPGLDRRFRQMGRELVATRARMAEMEAEAAAMRARLERVEGRGARIIPAAFAPKQPATTAAPRRLGAAAKALKGGVRGE